MKEIKLSVELVNALLGYLGSRPYQEVHELIKAIQKAGQEQLAQPAIEDKKEGE